ncbi:MAG: ABC transporter ATP-binding protein [Candidatus Omnitrophica bacterium]|nr:ABC transporter ATP-binding protein [Candidatus Omnitrophota bacterium]
MAFLFSIIAQYPFLIVASVLISLLTTVTEIFGIGLLVPFLQIIQDVPNVTIKLPMIGNVVGIFTNYLHQFPTVVRVRIVLGFFALAVLLQFICFFLSLWASGIMQKKTGVYLSDKIYKKLLKIPLQSLYERKGGYFYSILGNHCLVVASFASRVIDIIPKTFIGIVLLFFMFKLSWAMTGLALLILAITSLLMTRFHLMARKVGADFKTGLENRNSLLLETISGMKTIRQFVKESFFAQKHTFENEELLQMRFNIVVVTEAVKASVQFISMLSLIALVFVGSFLFDASTSLWIQSVILFIAVLSRLMPVVSSFNDFFVNFSANRHLIKAVSSFSKDFYVSEEDAKSQSPAEKKIFNETIEFDDVYFRYSEKDRIVLQKLSFVIPFGKVIALVGSSGAGKTTIIDLLLKFYSPQEGKIKVDGCDLNQIDTDFWRKQIGIVSQDTFLFNDTVAFNIGLGNPQVSEEKIMEAAKAAYADSFIRNLPQGLNTILGDRGVKLSVGQRQRIAIARAFILNPRILIWDEATSNLDALSEKEIMKAIDNFIGDRTIIAITHRLSTIKNADKILVLDDGKIVESGNHEDLIVVPNGLYNRFIKTANN